MTKNVYTLVPRNILNYAYYRSVHNFIYLFQNISNNSIHKTWIDFSRITLKITAQNLTLYSLDTHAYAMQIKLKSRRQLDIHDYDYLSIKYRKL